MNGNTNRQSAWLVLEAQARRIRKKSLAWQHGTASKIKVMKLPELEVDLSRQRLDEDTIDSLHILAEQSGFKKQRQALFTGAPINNTEGRPALHMALRQGVAENLTWKGQRIVPEVRKVLTQMEDFVTKLHTGRWYGHTGKPIREVVHIGIGGSHLGPMMVCRALQDYGTGRIFPRFVANIDSCALSDVIAGLNPDETLFFIASKSFTTREMLLNASTARAWLLERGVPLELLGRHFIAATAYPERAVEFGVPPAHSLRVWDWVGGRFSLWSAIGLCIAVQIGMPGFRRLLAGAQQADHHFQHAPITANIPLILALLDIWNFNFLQLNSHIILPYSERLSLLPDYIQQLQMESNGKHVTVTGERTSWRTSPVVWGGVGSSSQHSFHQLLHQGHERIAIDFILPLKEQGGYREHHDWLVSFCLAQGATLMHGHNSQSGADRSVHRQTLGNQVSTQILLSQLTPFSLGKLMALYEHKMFCQGLLWNINPFDQFGVELGKVLGNDIYDCLHDGHDEKLDQITRRQLDLYRQHRFVP